MKIKLAADTVDISGVTGRFVAQQWWALGLIVAFFLVIFIGLRILSVHIQRSRIDAAKDSDAANGSDGIGVDWTRFGLLVGLDNRVSTSRTVALLWTAVVGYCLLALVLIATTAPTSTHNPTPPNTIPPGFLPAALAALTPTYFVFLGVAYGAAVTAQVTTTQGLATGRIQKTRKAGKASVLETVTDDEGNVDLADLQYTLFNLIAAVYVITQFVLHPGQGIPAMPTTLLTLAGVSAAGYATKKVLTSNRAVISDVVPGSVPAGDDVTVSGDNLLVSPDPTNPKKAQDAIQVSLVRTGTDPCDTLAPGDDPTVTAAVVSASEASSNDIVFQVPVTLRPGTWRVRVRNNAGSVLKAPGTLTVLAPNVTKTASESIGVGVG